ncbi:ABC transporter ATP-binding protein [Cognatishimia sp. 1_MG-2023]|uniref:ABC transporter ATP-binding protein n=1 Tax=Cognatishimia sp. 1_MG-2023 TaxID=3062642 RepID=UPI0026E1F72D|nr:ABC transporter ATP-binding protein [Cognatishimia sp. 1_MG-2023]MDO6728224.1 ABC transporter ATP-binding protein [Cognatishimia sp. 1_MG-2023]
MSASEKHTTDPALELRGVTISYGAIRAARSVDLTVGAGEIVTLIGPNGAGKSSTLMGTVGLAPRGGAVLMYGEDVSNASTEQLVRKGLTLSPEGRRIFGNLSVAENLRLGGATARKTAGETEERLLDAFPKLRARYGQQAGTLSGGEQQMLAIARALMSNPSIVLLDEPSLGLAPKIVDTIFETIEQLRTWKISVLLVEQDIERALEVSDRGYVMSHGEIQMTGTSNELLTNANLKEMFFGENA